MTLGKPSTTFAEDLYQFHWTDLGVEMLLERFSESKDDIRCELTVTSSHPTRGGQLYEGRLLLIGPNSLRDVSKHLMERDGETDWSGMIQQVRTLAKQRYRQGEPVISLATTERSSSTKFALPPLVVSGGTTIWFGDGDSTKSLLALGAAVSVATGVPVLGMHPNIRGPVIYFDWEDDRDTHIERIHAICAPLGIETPEDVYHQRQTASLAEGVREARKTIAQKGAVMAIIDSVGASSTDPDSAEAIVRTFNAARTFGIPTICIHHVAKDAKDKTKPYGSVYAVNAARLTWRIDKKTNAGEDSVRVALTNFKSNRGRKEHGLGFEIGFYSDENDNLLDVSFAPTDIRDMEEFREKLGLKQQFIQLLREAGRPVETEELASLTSVTPSVARVTLNREKDTFVNTTVTEKKALWGLLSKHLVSES